MIMIMTAITIIMIITTLLLVNQTQIHDNDNNDSNNNSNISSNSLLLVNQPRITCMAKYILPSAPTRLKIICKNIAYFLAKPLTPPWIDVVGCKLWLCFLDPPQCK